MKNPLHFLFPFGSASKLLAFCASCLAGLTVFGQGTVLFSNLGAPGYVINSLTGQRAESGTTFTVALYFAPNGVTDESKFTQVGDSVNMGVDGGVPHSQLAGRFIGGTVTAPIWPPGGFGMFQVRAWETMFGPTYEHAVANTNPQNGRLALAGESGIMRVDTGDPTLPEPGLPTALALPSDQVAAVVGAPLSDGFLLTVVPEPGSILLLVFGLPPIVLLSFRRLK